MSFSSIGIALKTAMDLVKNTDAKVGSVYNHDIKIEDWVLLPAIIITPIDWDEVMFDSCKNKATFNFAVRVIDDIQTNQANVEANMRILADTVLDRLKDMNNVVYSDWETYSLEYTYSWGYIETQAPLRVFEIICIFKAVEDI